MKVTPIKRKFGKYAPGDVFTLPDKAAKLFIKARKLAQAKDDAPVAVPTYGTRMLQAAPVVAGVTREVEAADPVEAFEPATDGAEEAPYGYKADGTPRKRPGRPAASE
jgi:hypothetical protein